MKKIKPHPRLKRRKPEWWELPPQPFVLISPPPSAYTHVREEGTE